jgi:hypothetical protein
MRRRPRSRQSDMVLSRKPLERRVEPIGDGLSHGRCLLELGCDAGDLVTRDTAILKELSTLPSSQQMASWVEVVACRPKRLQEPWGVCRILSWRNTSSTVPSASTARQR